MKDVHSSWFFIRIFSWPFCWQGVTNYRNRFLMISVIPGDFGNSWHRCWYYSVVNGAFDSLDIYIKTPRLTIDRLDELFIKFWTLEGAVTERGAAITIWRLKPTDQSNRFNCGCSHYNMAFYGQWPMTH